MLKVLIVGVLSVLLINPPQGKAQEEEDGIWFSPGSLAGPVSMLLLPKVAQDLHALRGFICSDEFALSRMGQGDLQAVDGIFTRALALSGGNRYEALFLCLFATMDHRRFGVNLPLVGPLLWFPLTSEFEEEFEARVRALPGRLYPDSPPASGGDRDKLQHFFGSALLAYWFESRSVPERVGEMIERGEEQLIVEGVYDERDLRANRHGLEFGTTLLERPEILPSDILVWVLAEARVRRQNPLPTEPCGTHDMR